MKSMIYVLLFVIAVYLIFQALYTGYFFVKSKSLVGATFAGEKNIGDSNNPKFNLFVDGDSVGAGVGASSFDTSVAGRVAAYYAKNNYVHIINNSLNGSKMSSLVDKKIPSENQNLTLLIISSNDLFHFTNLGEFKKSTEKVLDKYIKNTDKLIIIGPGRVFDTTSLPFFIKPLYRLQGAKYAKIIESVSKKYPNVIYVNPQNVAVLQSQYGPTDAVDGFHPNDEGHRFWFDLIKPSL